jgi:hypothetical protein
MRRLADAPVGGRRVLTWLRVRVLCCGNAGCATRTFAEQPGGLASRYARRTPLAGRALTAVAVALAGRAGAALAAVLAVTVSRHTLVRMLMALPDPPGGSVRVLGVDDFSLRRGRTYATLLVDMEAGLPVDVLPDREAATLQAWLGERPGVQVICRDRAGAYAQAARDGAPQAVQVADRWHLWHNLCEHAGKAVARHQGCLPEPAGPAPAGDPEPVIRERHAAVLRLRAAGQTQAQAAAALGLSLQLTGRYWRAASAEALLKVRGASALDPWKPYLRSRWDAGITSIAVLHREITALGYAGSEPATYAWLALLKLAAPPKPPAPPTRQQVTGWMLTDPARLDDGQQEQLTAICGRCPELEALAGHVTAFAKILTRRAGDHPAAGLDDWLAAAQASPGQPELASFASGIRRDYQAVRNALTLEWNSGRVEGLNTRTKLLKRQMYGRATFPLLRKRILLTS